MEFHPLPILTSFLLVVVVVSHAYSLPSDVDGKSALPITPFRKAMRNLLMQPGSSTDAQKHASSIAEYEAVYGNPQKVEGSPINSHKDGSPIAGYDAVYGNPQKAGGSSIKAHNDANSVAGYDAVYGNPQKLGRSSTNAHHKDAGAIAGYDAVYGSTKKQGDASPIAGYDAVYGSTKKQGDASPITGYDAVYGSTKKQGDASPIAGYDAVYGSTKKQGDASPITGYDAVYGSTKKQGDASPIAGYDAVYGSTKKQGDASPIAGYDAVYGSTRKQGDASPIAGYDAVYGTSQKAEESSINVHKDASSIAGYDAVYGNSQQKAGGSSINAHKDSSPVASYGAVNVFLEKDLHPGTKMAVRFTKTSSAAHFLPHQVAESIPFSSNKLPEILKRFSMKENSAEAQMIQKTIKQCETPAIVGEVKYCARSLESLIDFSTSRLGKNIRVLSNEVEADIQEYKFGEGVKMVGEKSVVCHQLNYPYAVAFCHTLHMTKIYMVPLVGADGTRVEAVAVCHRDTSTWDPKALVFQSLKVKPGTLPICHFLPNGHIVWVPK
ncbi:protein RAFTIN 1A-like isoform X2 [Vitis riparia]|uniref:protein RAFTIN 1A-like isoform X2 n=1 Tax=Vitis riparia TaxID=96939 RepID=UPI00155A5205|nr:protein RAFTIN 1A-like isoform X2 [Vitis riparia]